MNINVFLTFVQPRKLGVPFIQNTVRVHRHT